MIEERAEKTFLMRLLGIALLGLTIFSFIMAMIQDREPIKYVTPCLETETTFVPMPKAGGMSYGGLPMGPNLEMVPRTVCIKEGKPFLNPDWVTWKERNRV